MNSWFGNISVNLKLAGLWPGSGTDLRPRLDRLDQPGRFD
jgi:hypothetical protein